MIFSTFNEFKKNSTKKNFSQIYAIKNKPKLQTIEKITIINKFAASEISTRLNIKSKTPAISVS